MHGNCKCPHHMIVKLLMVLVWVSAILFWWASWKVQSAGRLGADHLFKEVIVFTLLAFSKKFCGCCRKAMMMHGGMSCPACEGKGGEHTHGDHGHM